MRAAESPPAKPAKTAPERRFDAVLFDLLTALLDSPSLWDAVAGSAAAGRCWRASYLRLTYGTGAYRPYEDLVAAAAADVGLPRGRVAELEARYGELQPWPGVTTILRELAARGVPLGVVTNCSERLGRVAAARVGVDLTVLVTAERAGFYKPHPRPYRLALDELGLRADRCLFVAGSPYDLVGTGQVGLPTFWHDRTRMAPPAEAPTPLAHEPTLDGLAALVTGG